VALGLIQWGRGRFHVTIDVRGVSGVIFPHCPVTCLAETMRRALRAQLPEEDGPIVDFVVGQLDEDGRLACTAEEVVDFLDVEPERVARAIRRLQAIGPAGIGAHDLRECLLLQLEYLERNGQKWPLVREIIGDYMSEFAMHQDDSIAAALGIAPDAIEDARAFMRRHMKPFPGRKHAGAQPFGGIGEKGRVRPSRDLSRSRLKVQEAMWDLIGEESRPLSDRELAQALSELNIVISCQTAARYRIQMGIPPAHRRQWGRAYGDPERRSGGDPEVRAWALLYDLLDERERRQLTIRGYLQVNSPSRPVRSYRITADGGRVLLYERGRAVCELCVGPAEPLPAGDVILLHKLMIEADERTYLARANLLPLSRK
jgi:hypothetical protein